MRRQLSPHRRLNFPNSNSRKENSKIQTHQNYIPTLSQKARTQCVDIRAIGRHLQQMLETWNRNNDKENGTMKQELVSGLSLSHPVRLFNIRNNCKRASKTSHLFLCFSYLYFYLPFLIRWYFFALLHPSPRIMVWCGCGPLSENFQMSSPLEFCGIFKFSLGHELMSILKL